MATSPRPYQNDFRKYSKSANLFKRPKSMLKSRKIEGDFKHRVKLWVTFYRRNLHRFAEHYGNIKLYPFQKIWLYLMGISDIFVVVASRGISKSWIIALYSICMCILYPGSQIVIAAGSKKQAGLIITDKIQGFFMNKSPNFAREIKDVKANGNDWEVLFHNGSHIKVVPASDLARGNRATINIYEEFRIIDKKILDSVLSPFLISRQPPYLLKSEYSYLTEEPKEIYITSAYYKAEWWWDEFKKIVKMHYKDDRANFIGFDYLLAVYHGLKTKRQIKKEKEKLDEITFMQEYENIPFGENDNAYFKLDMFKKNRVLKKAFYPLRKDEYNKNKNPHDIKRVDGEIRVLSVDIATRKGKENDNTILSCIRAIPTSKGYQREVVYMESHQGENTILQTLRIKQVYYDFSADYIVLDLQQAGITIYEQLGLITKDEERGVEYDAFTVMDSKHIDNQLYKELQEKTLIINAKPVIFPILATAKLNSNIAVDFRDKLQRGMIKFLIDNVEAEEYLLTHVKEYVRTDDVALKVWYLQPYAQTAEMINETVNLEYSVVSGNIKLQEPSGKRKDRYTSVSYGNYFISLLEKDLLKQKDDFDWAAYALW